MIKILESSILSEFIDVLHKENNVRQYDCLLLLYGALNNI